MSIEPVKFLSDADLAYLDVYEYHGGEYSYIDTFLNPFWTKVAYAFPNWFAPNLITLSGLMINVVAALIVAYYDPTLVGAAPAWAYVNAAICLQIYAILDAADGKQARRLNASSPLGQIFDHGCDAVNLVFIILAAVSALGAGFGKLTSLAILFFNSDFVGAQLLEYQNGILFTGNKLFGVTEAMLGLSAFLVLTSVFGDQIWRIDLMQYLPAFAKVLPSCMIQTVFVTSMAAIPTLTFLYYALKALITGETIPEEKKGNKNVSRIDFLLRLVPVVVLFLCGYRLMTNRIAREHPMAVLFLVGLTYSFLSIRVNVSHLCRKQMSFRFNGMIPLVIATLNNVFHVASDAIVIPACLALFLMVYATFIITTINQIKQHLHIRAFHILKRDEYLVS